MASFGELRFFLRPGLPTHHALAHIMASTSKIPQLVFGLWVCSFFPPHFALLFLTPPLIAWHTLAAHQSFMEHESYVDFALPVMEAMIGSGEITQVLLSQQSAFIKAISSPITQFIYITLRPRHDRDYELEPLVERLASELALVPGCYASSWGPSVEHDDMYVGVVGWRCISVSFSFKYYTAFCSGYFS